MRQDFAAMAWLSTKIGNKMVASGEIQQIMKSWK
jgi:hypothetical protein